MKTAIMRFLRDEEGASAIEYALVAAMVAVVVIAFVPGIQTAIGGIFEGIRGALEEAAPAASAPAGG